MDSGSNAVLQCILGGDSNPGESFSWTGSAVTSGRAAISLDSSGTVSTLIITSVDQSDEGRYFCNYTNIGVVSVTLSVICKCPTIYPKELSSLLLVVFVFV